MKQSTKGSKRNTSLKGADLSGYDLTGANLRGAKLNNADLTDADLSRANLRNANLGSADMRKANLAGAKLKNANLYKANLNNARLMYADLSNTTLRWANLNGANLTDANLTNANLWGADLTNARLYDVNMSGVKQAEQLDKDFDKDKADRNKDGKISDWEQAVGNKVAKGIRESDKSSSKDSVQAVLDGYRTVNKGSLMILTPILVGLGLVEIYKRVSDKSDVSAAEVADNSETSEPFDRMPGATQIVDNMVQRRKANNVLFEKNAPTLWPSGGLTVVNMIDAIQRGDNLPEFPTTKI